MESQTTVSKIGLKYGVILGIIFIIYSTIVQLLNVDFKTQNFLGWMVYLGLLVAIIFAIKEYKKDNNGFLKFGQGLGIGTLLSAVAGVISSLFSYLYIKFIDQSLLDKMRDAQLLEMENRGLSDEQIEQSMEMMEKFSGPGFIAVFSILGLVLLGFIFSLIVSAIMKNESADQNILDVE